MAAREVLEEESCDIKANTKTWAPIVPNGLTDDSIKLLTDALVDAKNPLIITSYLGRNMDSVAELVQLCERLAVPVVEVSQHSYMNFPSDNPLHLGFESESYIRNADLIFVIDCDLPWVPALSQPQKDCRVFYLDVDPLKEHLPLWYIPSEGFFKVDSYVALKQINKQLNDIHLPNLDQIEERHAKIKMYHKQKREQWKSKETMGLMITPEFLTACVGEVLDEDAIVLNETTSYRAVVDRHLPRSKPGTLFSNGGGSLGWNGGAAIGMKLAHPEKTVVALTGDGTFIFTCPTAVFWVARKYSTPFLTIIYNNQGWAAPKNATIGEHPEGYAFKYDKFWVNFDPPAQLDLVAEAAGGAFAKTVKDPRELKKILLEGLDAVRKGNSAVINVLLASVSTQQL